MKSLILSAVVLSAVYALLMAFVYFNQSRLIYYPQLPSRVVSSTPEEMGLEYEPVRITTEDGVVLDAWYVPHVNENAAAPEWVMVVFHGNAGNIGHRLDTLRIFNTLGFSSLIFDYRGYGRSTGYPTEAGTYRDAEAVWEYLTRERGVPSGRILYFGRSLGAAIAANLALRHPPAALILESAFTSVPDLAAELYPLLPARRMSRFQYNTLAALSEITRPVLIIHSRDDEIVPFSHGRRLYEAAPGAKRFLEIKGGHNDGFLLSGEHYLQGVRAFAEEVTGPR